MGAIQIGRSGQFDEFRRDCVTKLEDASLVAADRTAARAAQAIRSRLPGKLGGGIGQGSDLKKGRRAYRTPTGGYRASGWIFIRGKSDRTVGAIEAATEGADIKPVNSPWLWISTDEIPRFVGRKRMTPALYRSSGLESRIGPLVEIPGRHSGESLLAVYHVSVDRFGRPGRARRLPKRGALGSAREVRTRIIAFVGITNTSRSQVADVPTIISFEMARLPEYRDAELKR